jgi:XTP/dITP diphosphohydrolase
LALRTSVADHEIRFTSGNPRKIEEAQSILSEAGMTVIPVTHRIEELQTEDAVRLVRDKALKAFDLVRRPVFVEHTGLYLTHLGGLPGGLTQIFWDTLLADRFAELFGRTEDPSVTARTTIGYIDGRRFYTFQGESRGTITSEPRGSRDFQWDCVFQPNESAQTFAEMGTDAKNAISMRRHALDAFASFLLGER